MAIVSASVLLNGSTHPVQLDTETGLFSVELVAPPITSYLQPKHYYDIQLTVNADDGLSAVFNSDNFDQLALYVRELEAPVVKMLTPPDGTFVRLNQPQQILFNVLDQTQGAGVDPKSICATYNDVSLEVSTVPIANGFRCSAVLENVVPGVYNIEVSGSDFDGNQSAFNGITLYHDFLVYDRTPQDVAQIEQMTGLQVEQYFWPLKAQYDNRDFNRILGAMSYLYDLFVANSIVPDHPITLKPIYTYRNLIYTDRVTKLLDDVNMLKNIWLWIPGVPPIPSDLQNVTIEQTNNLELALHTMIKYVRRVAVTNFYAGEINAGEDYQ